MEKKIEQREGQLIGEEAVSEIQRRMKELRQEESSCVGRQGELREEKENLKVKHSQAARQFNEAEASLVELDNIRGQRLQKLQAHSHANRVRALTRPNRLRGTMQS